MTDYISRQAAIEALAGWKISPIVLDPVPSADVVEADKAQKEIDYWHDKAQSYEQTILRLTLNKADVVEVVRCKDCKHWINQKDGVVEVPICARRVRGDKSQYPCIMLVGADDFCSYGMRADK